jgi:AraC-like DNA-binding protein
MFKTLFGMPPIHYVNRMRMEAAKRLLLTTDRSVSSIAEEFGLQLYYFSRVFKKYSGFTPSEFRGLVRVEK